MKLSMFKINVKERTALLLSGGTAKFNTTNLNTVALAVARLFTLPISSPNNSSPSLSTYANKHIYISSFLTSQREILNSVQKATGTTDKDWKIENMDVEEFIEEGRRMIASGEWMGVANLVYGATMKEGPGGDYESVRGVANEILGLEKEDLDECVRGLLPALFA
jgi:hypothetical protein